MTPFKSSLVVVELMGFCYYCFCLYKTQLAKKKKKEKTVDLNVLVFFFFRHLGPLNAQQSSVMPRLLLYS